MDGFSLCSVDSLTTGAPDCTLRRFSGATENRCALVVPGWGAGGVEVQSRRCIMNRTPPPPGASSVPRQPPIIPWPPLYRLSLPPPQPPLGAPSCNHVHPPHQPIISPYYVTSRCVTWLSRAAVRASSRNSKNDDTRCRGKRLTACAPGMGRGGEVLVTG